VAGGGRDSRKNPVNRCRELLPAAGYRKGGGFVYSVMRTMTVSVRWSLRRALGVPVCIALFCAIAAPSVDAGEPGPNPVPFYRDKMNLLVWLDAQGQTHPVRDAQAWHQRRQHILANMQLVMGPLPARGHEVPLDIRVVKTEKLPKLTRQKITYAADQGDRVPAYLLIPRGLQGRVPAMLCLHGSSGGRGRTAGLGPDYPRYTLELAERGYVTIAPDYPLLLGENQTDPAALGYASGTMKGIWDHMRAVDLLQSLPEVDRERIGCIGVSLGGHNALFVGAFDPRLKVIVTSSGFDSFTDYKQGDLSGWCQTHYMPRIESVFHKDPQKMPFDLPEVLAAIAPRHLYIHAPQSDSNFRVESVKRCVQAATAVYGLFGVGDRIVSVYPPGEHGFPPEARENAYQFIDKVLCISVNDVKTNK
jgi:dienelactone hydrolase